MDTSKQHMSTYFAFSQAIERIKHPFAKCDEIYAKPQPMDVDRIIFNHDKAFTNIHKHYKFIGIQRRIQGYCIVIIIGENISLPYFISE